MRANTVGRFAMYSLVFLFHFNHSRFDGLAQDFTQSPKSNTQACTATVLGEDGTQDPTLNNNNPAKKFQYTWNVDVTWSCSSGQTSACAIAELVTFSSSPSGQPGTYTDIASSCTIASGACSTNYSTIFTTVFPATGNLVKGTYYQAFFMIGAISLGGNCDNLDSSTDIEITYGWQY